MEIRKTKTDPIDAAIIADMLRFSEPPLANQIRDLNLYQLRELIRVRQRLVDKRTRCKIQLIRNLDMIWPGYKTIMPLVFGKTSLAVPELDSITSTEIKYLISQIELNDENLMRYFNKKMSEGKHYYSALNATAAKILRIVFWVLKNDKEYKLQLA